MWGNKYNLSKAILQRMRGTSEAFKINAALIAEFIDIHYSLYLLEAPQVFTILNLGLFDWLQF